ncbi:MAG: hypothetical protein AAF481_04990 [Acidobacteriota bacterium]
MIRRRGVQLAMALTLVLTSMGPATAPLTAQPPAMRSGTGEPWSGGATLGVEVKTRKKQLLEGAEVEIRFAEIEPISGPPIRLTGQDGRVAYGGLAEGRWRIDIRREGYSSYLLVVRVVRGGKAAIVSGPIRDATGAPLRVATFNAKAADIPRDPEFAQPTPEPAPPVPQPAPAPAKPAVPSQPPEQEPPAPEPPMEELPAPQPRKPDETPQPADRPEPEPSAEEPPPSEEGLPESAPAPEPPQETEPAPPEASTPQPATPQPATPQPATPQPAAPQPEPIQPAQPQPTAAQPAPQEEAAPEAPEPAAPQPAAPQPAAPKPEISEPAPEAPAPPPSVAAMAPRIRTSTVLRSAGNGTCGECKAGEAAFSMELPAGPGAGTCPDDLAERMTRVAEHLATAPSFAGALVGSGSESLRTAAGDGLATTVEREIMPLVTGGSCLVVAAVLPKGARYTGYLYEVADALGTDSCLAGQECSLGDSRWSDHPTIEKTANGTLLWGVFRNTSPDRERRARLTVYFSP